MDVRIDEWLWAVRRTPLWKRPGKRRWRSGSMKSLAIGELDEKLEIFEQAVIHNSRFIKASRGKPNLKINWFEYNFRLSAPKSGPPIKLPVVSIESDPFLADQSAGARGIAKKSPFYSNEAKVDICQTPLRPRRETRKRKADVHNATLGTQQLELTADHENVSLNFMNSSALITIQILERLLIAIISPLFYMVFFP